MKRMLLLVLIVLAIPARALAMPAEGGPAPAGIVVSVTFDHCATTGGQAVAGSQILCQLDVSFNEVAGASRYTASASGPDGVASQYGEVQAGDNGLWVPYVGDGTYSVTITAWDGPATKRQAPAQARAATSQSAGGRQTRARKPRSHRVDVATTRTSAPARHAPATRASRPGPSPAPVRGPHESQGPRDATSGSNAPAMGDASADAPSEGSSPDCEPLEDQTSADASSDAPACPDGTAPTQDGSPNGCCPAPPADG